MKRDHHYRQLSDLELIAEYRRTRDQQYVGIIFDRYLPLIYGVCLKYLKNREDARDEAMAVYEKLVHTLLANPIEQFKGWLYVLTKNQCLMTLRGKKGKISVEFNPSFMEIQPLVHLEEESEIDQNFSALEKCLEKLGQEQKWCVSLFYLQKKCYLEIVKETQYELNQVKSFIQNGKRNLKICLEKNGIHHPGY